MKIFYPVCFCQLSLGMTFFVDIYGTEIRTKGVSKIRQLVCGFISKKHYELFTDYEIVFVDETTLKEVYKFLQK